METEKERVDLFQYYRADGKFSSASLFLLPSVDLSPKITDFQSLKKIGFLNIYLYDETEGFIGHYPDSLLLIFNPSVSINEDYWESFETILKSYNNFICVNYYDYCIYGVWMKISDKFNKNLRFLFEIGKFSKFGNNYISFLGNFEQNICKQDEEYRLKLEKRLGLKEGYLIGRELASIPDKPSYTFKYIKNEEFNNI